MNGFWILTAALTAATVGGLLPALFRPRPVTPERHTHRTLHEARLAELYRDVEDKVIAEHDLPAAQDEIARALLEEASTSVPAHDRSGAVARWLSVALIICSVPTIALLTYFKVGEPTLALGATPDQMDNASFEQNTIDEMIASLEQRIIDDPNSAEAWVLLGRSYMALNRYNEAVPALARAHELIGDIPRILLQYADALAMANNGRINDDARALVARALEFEPDNITALWLAGLAAQQAGERGPALNYLRRARKLGAQNGMPSGELDAIIQGLEAKTKVMPVTATASTSVSVRIDVDPALSTRFEAQDVLFVFAQAPGQDGPPLAIKRVAAGSLPRELILDDTMAIAPDTKLRRGETVALTARISKAGSPRAQSGDLQGSSKPFVIGDGDAPDLVIDEVVK